MLGCSTYVQDILLLLSFISLYGTCSLPARAASPPAVHQRLSRRSSTNN